MNNIDLSTSWLLNNIGSTIIHDGLTNGLKEKEENEYKKLDDL